jgi:UTP--glucose-1-phosphate uridylyltransferase
VGLMIAAPLVRKFKIFNTNNLWINLKGKLYLVHFHLSMIDRTTMLALKRIMETEGMDLEIIVNPKVTDDGQSVIQVRFEPNTSMRACTVALLYSILGTRASIYHLSYH